MALTGAADPLVPAEEVAGFAQEMITADVRFVLKAYPGVSHSFTNPDADRVAEEHGFPIGYDRDADEDSWALMQTFLAESFAEN